MTSKPISAITPPTTEQENPRYESGYSGKVINVFIYAFLTFWALVVIFPMIWVLVTSFKTDQEIFFSPWMPPAKLIFDNFVRAWTKANIGLYLFNSLVVILPSIFFTLLF